MVYGAYGEFIQRIFIHPHYLSITLENIRDIEISLRDDKGGLIPFKLGKAIVKLH